MLLKVTNDLQPNFPFDKRGGCNIVKVVCDKKKLLCRFVYV